MFEPMTVALRNGNTVVLVGTTNIQKNPYDNKVTAIIFSVIFRACKCLIINIVFLRYFPKNLLFLVIFRRLKS